MLHRESHTCVAVVCGVNLAAVGEHWRARQTVQGLLVLIHRQLIVAFSIGRAAFSQQGVALRNGILTTDHFPLGETAESRTTFACRHNSYGDWHGRCHGHQREGSATGTIDWRFLHSEMRFSGDVFEVWKAIFSGNLIIHLGQAALADRDRLLLASGICIFNNYGVGSNRLEKIVFTRTAGREGECCVFLNLELLALLA